MIENITLLWLGTMAVAATFGGLRVAVPRYRDGESSLTGIFAYGFGLLFWALFTLHSSEYMRSLGGGVSQSVNTPSFMAAGVIGGLVCLLLLFDAATRAIGSNT